MLFYFLSILKAQNNIINIGGVINLQMGHVYNETLFVGTSNDPPPPVHSILTKFAALWKLTLHIVHTKKKL